jgi:hypothetical protein
MPIKRSSIPKLHLEVPTTMGAFMGIERRSFLTASASVILTVTTIGGHRRSDQLAAGRDCCGRISRRPSSAYPSSRRVQLSMTIPK